MPCRADALLLGVLGAVLIRSALWKERLQQNRRIMQLLLGCLAAGVIVLTVLEKHHEELRWITVGHTWMAAFYWSVLMYAVINQRSWLSWFLRWGWLGWLGGIAYGTYLFHMYALLLVFRAFFPGDSTGQFVVNGPAQWGVIGVALFATLVLCRFSWRYFEKPLLQLGHRAKYEFAATRHADASSPLA
jgi:peptidoglycan/LPS O-acetylase OafA/YrhL